MIDWLLRNGYGIEDLATAWVYVNGIMEASKPFTWYEEFARTNTLAEKLGIGYQADPHRLYEEDIHDRRLRLARHMKIFPEEGALIDSLLAIAPDPPRPSGLPRDIYPTYR